MGELIATIAKWMTTNKECISLVVDIWGTIATVAAVIVAIVANCKANQSLKYSLKMQEQSKNIDLFEKRLAVIDEIKEKTKVSKLHLGLLFNDSIVSEYNKMLDFWNEHANAYHDLNVYSDAIEVMDGEGGYTSPMAELEDAERTLEELGYPADKVKSFDALCDKYQISHSESGENKDIKIYNYKELSGRIASTKCQFDDQKKSLIDLMQHFVKDSISPIGKKGGKSKNILLQGQN